MWIPAILMLYVLAIVVAHYWMVLLAVLILWAVVKYIRLVVADTKARPKPPKAVRAPAEPPPAPAGPEYQPRWSKSRRKDARRELAQWQELFDSHVV